MFKGKGCEALWYSKTKSRPRSKKPSRDDREGEEGEGG